MSRDRLARLSARIGVRGEDERISAVVSLV
jgi:hypothetical protein